MTRGPKRELGGDEEAPGGAGPPRDPRPAGLAGAGLAAGALGLRPAPPPCAGEVRRLYLIVPINKAQLAETTFRRSPRSWQSAILEPRKKSDFSSNARVHRIS